MEYCLQGCSRFISVEYALSAGCLTLRALLNCLAMPRPKLKHFTTWFCKKNVFFINYSIFCNIKKNEASRGAAAQSVNLKPTGCRFDPHSRRWNIYLNLYYHFFDLVSRQNAALSTATQHAMPPESGRKLGKECLNTRFPLPTLLYAGYSVKLIKKNTAWILCINSD